MTLFTDLLSSIFDRRSQPVSSTVLSGLPIEDLSDALVGEESDMSVQALGVELLQQYAAMDDAGKAGFFWHLARNMAIDAAKVRDALDAYEAQPSKSNYRAFMDASEPPRQELVRQLNRVPHATAALVRMRADLLRFAKAEPELAALDLDFRHLFASWFNRGFLVLRPINWESPAHILEKVIAYEAVHEITSWEDLRRRLQPTDRRCFAFFHPVMPDEPLIFVEVALIAGEANSIQELLAEDRVEIPAHTADTAVFYSISNCQAGLAQISFGSSLIKQVAADLAAELGNIKSFVTLSPIPRLRSWAEHHGYSLDTASDDQLTAIAAHYLLTARRPDGQPYDPVARFHLGNGALIFDVHPRADTSQTGRLRSGEVMVNYLYDLASLAENQEQYRLHNEVIARPQVAAVVAKLPNEIKGQTHG